MNDLIKSIDALLARIAPIATNEGSTERYLQNNLLDYKAVLQNSSNPRDIENATRALIRFCTDSMDWDNLLYSNCSAITTQGMKLAKQ